MDDTKARLRSESAPNAARVARVMEGRARAQRVRAALAEDFRARLTREVSLDGSAAQEALIDCAVSAHVEIAVISARFLRCTATSDEMERLAAARGQLNRTLRLLGATPKAPHDPNTPPGQHATPEARAEWSKRYVASLIADEKSPTQ